MKTFESTKVKVQIQIDRKSGSCLFSSLLTLTGAERALAVADRGILVSTG
jgi:hypothetical protein